MIKQIFEDGFSLLEVLIVLVIGVTIVLFTTVNIEGFRRSSFVADSAREIITTLEAAKSKTTSGEGGIAYKVHFTADSFSLMKADGSVLVKTQIDQSLEIVPPTSDIVYSQISGNSNGGTIIVRHKSGSPSKTITVLASGIINQQ
ncbi:prepilin-type N-terminal cleavage/methylation domain-containing protein [Candidatus Curtissbacteria bacterium]|nr:prepilin-type N-terminal cleavage/methylation domain-containing protein [Candidatus Curtissbacteria bacterium]